MKNERWSSQKMHLKYVTFSMIGNDNISFSSKFDITLSWKKWHLNDQPGFAWVVTAPWQKKKKSGRPEMTNKTDVPGKMVS